MGVLLSPMETHVCLAVITARGRSKGLPRKNVLPVAGKPLIAWTIEAALTSCRLTRVTVSTDDEEIAEVARMWGAEVPFVRPEGLAQDNSPHMDVIIHAIEWLGNHENYEPDFIMLLQPTSPLRTAEDIDTSIEMVLRRNGTGIVSVSETPSHPYLAKTILEDGTLAGFVDTPGGYLPRQSFPLAYAVNGAIYLARREVLLKEHSWYTSRTYPYIMPPERSLDADTAWDQYLVGLILEDRLSHAND